MEKRFRSQSGIQVHPERLNGPLRRKKPTVWAVWNDVFHPDVSFDFLVKISQTIWQSGRERNHIFLLLTKRIERAAEFFRKYPYSAFPNNPNYWMGVTVCNQQEADEKIPILLQIPAAVRWVSIEPMLELINIDFRSLRERRAGYHSSLDGSPIQWIVVGGETGPGARWMKKEWVQSVRDQCRGAAVPFFFKQWGPKKSCGRLLDGREWNEIPL